MTFNEELEVLLVEELDCLKKLRNLSFEKTDYIIKSDLEKLSQVTKREEGLVLKIGELEKNRIELLETWGVGGNTPLSDVIERVVGDKDKLTGLMEGMIVTLGELEGRNLSNNELIRDNLEWIDFNLNLMTSTQTPGAYNKDSMEEDKGGDRNIFDRKV